MHLAVLVPTQTFVSLGAPISHAADPAGTEDALVLSHVRAAAVAATAAFAAGEVVASSVDASADAAIIAEDSGVAEGAIAAEGAGLVEPTFSSVPSSNDIDWLGVVVAVVTRLRLTITKGAEHPSFEFVQVISAPVNPKESLLSLLAELLHFSLVYHVIVGDDDFTQPATSLVENKPHAVKEPSCGTEVR